MISFKEGFKRARKSTGLSQAEFADKYHFSLPSVKKWEQGKAVPESETLISLCEIFKCDMSYLFYQIELPTHDLQFVHEQTGLTMAAIKKIGRIYVDNPEYSDVISALMEDSNFEYLLYLISKRFSYSIPSEDIKPIIEEKDGVTHIKNAKQFHESLNKKEVKISLDGAILMAQKKNLLDSLISSALTDRMQNMAEVCKNIKGGNCNG